MTHSPAKTEAMPLTTGESLLAAAARWPERDAIVVDGSRLTWAMLRDQAMTRARSLIGLGIKPGDHVGLLMPNCADYIVLFCAIGLVGARALTINARYREHELAHVLRHADVDLLIIGGHALPQIDHRAHLLRSLPKLAEWDGSDRITMADAPRLRAVINLADNRERHWPGEAALDRAAAGVKEDAVLARAAKVSPDDVQLGDHGATEGLPAITRGAFPDRRRPGRTLSADTD
jgi:fatty-acyl-CoA synthase